MDGWESRRKRGPGPRLVHPRARARRAWCSASTSTPTTSSGNIPPFASVDGLLAPRGTPLDELDAAPRGRELSPQAPLRPGAQNLFARVADASAGDPRAPQHLPRRRRGALPRLRRVHAGWGDRRARRRDARARSARRARRSGGGQERRPRAGLLRRVLRPHEQPAPPRPRREHGRRLGDPAQARPRPRLDRRRSSARRDRPRSSRSTPTTSRATSRTAARSSAIDAPGARITELIASQAVDIALCRETKLSRDHAALLRRAARRSGPLTHVRLNIYPDGGVSRLRVWGRRDALSRTSVLNALSDERGPRGAPRAAAARPAGRERMLARRPFASTARCSPRPSEPGPSSAATTGSRRSRTTRASASDARRSREKLRGDRRLVRAGAGGRRGRRRADAGGARATATAPTSALRLHLHRLRHGQERRRDARAACARASATTPSTELRIAAGEQAKITRLRLEKLASHEHAITPTSSTPPSGRPARGLARAPRRARRRGRLARARPSASPTTTAA